MVTFQVEEEIFARDDFEEVTRFSIQYALLDHANTNVTKGIT